MGDVVNLAVVRQQSVDKKPRAIFRDFSFVVFTPNAPCGSIATETRRPRHVRYSPKCCRNIALPQPRQCTEFGSTAKEPESCHVEHQVSAG
jgi:hypothetical protein